MFTVKALVETSYITSYIYYKAITCKKFLKNCSFIGIRLLHDSTWKKNPIAVNHCLELFPMQCYIMLKKYPIGYGETSTERVKDGLSICNNLEYCNIIAIISYIRIIYVATEYYQSTESESNRFFLK